jgi:hypothetical protein
VFTEPSTDTLQRAATFFAALRGRTQFSSINLFRVRLLAEVIGQVGLPPPPPPPAPHFLSPEDEDRASSRNIVF